MSIKVEGNVLNVTFSVGEPGSLDEQYMDPDYVQHKIYLSLETLIRLSTIQVNVCFQRK